ncbi:MAG TPA: outer membrane protein assembly factor BamD [Ferruginibacter sp.]|nr:outer membrane protein assembly factor BamD [Ferruginibacter sp.]
MRSLKFFLLSALIVASLGACNKYNKVLKSKDPNYQLAKADEYFAKKRYKAAQAVYEELFSSLKGSPKFEELYYKYAYCYYAQKMYREAENLFKGYLETFPNSARAEEVDYLHAFCFYKQSPKVELEQVNTAKAIGMMQTFINTHPGSARIKDANEIIDKSRAKLEQKDYRAAELYYNLGHYRAAALAFGTLINSYPESTKGEEYKLKTVRSYYRFAQLSIIEKQIERYEKVVTEYEDFVDRYPDSKLLKDAENYKNLSLNHIKDIKNEQTQTSVKR